METKDRIKFDDALNAPLPGRAREVSDTQRTAETDGLRAMAAWAQVAQQGG